MEIGQSIYVRSKVFGRYKHAKQALLSVYNSGWSTVAVRGTVLSRSGNDKWIVEWDFPGRKLKVTMKETVLLGGRILQNDQNMPISPVGDVASVEDDMSPDEEREGDEWDSDASFTQLEEQYFMLPGGRNALECAMDGKTLNWVVCSLGVNMDQRTACGYAFRQTTIRWPAHIQVLARKPEIDCWQFLFPWSFFFGTNRSVGSCLLWTNDNLPPDVTPFTVHEWVQFIGLLYGRTLVPKGRMRYMWGHDRPGFVPSMDVGRRFGISRRRYETWRKYLKFWPPSADHAQNRFDMIRPLVEAFNQNRIETINAGSELVIDESMGKWRPYIQVRRRYYIDCALNVVVC